MENTRICSKCREAIPGFRKTQYLCSPCDSEYRKKWRERWTPGKKLRAAEQVKKWQHENRDRKNATRQKGRLERLASDPVYREKINQQRREYAKADQGRDKKYQRKNQLKRYGLTPEDYERMLEKQNGVCAICFGLQRPTRNKRGETIMPDLAVDHCHTFENVRGLLCNVCNTALGRFNDDAQRFQRAADYLKGVMQ